MRFAEHDTLMKNLKALGMADEYLGLVAGALVDTVATASGAVQNTNYTVNSVTVPAGFFGKIKRGCLIFAWGTTAANANAKNIRILLGTTEITIVTGTTANAKDYSVALLVLRTAVDTQIVAPIAVLVDGAVVAASGILDAGAEDDAVAMAISVTLANTAAAAASGTGKGLVVIPFGQVT